MVFRIVCVLALIMGSVEAVHAAEKIEIKQVASSFEMSAVQMVVHYKATGLTPGTKYYVKVTATKGADTWALDPKSEKTADMFGQIIGKFHGPTLLQKGQTYTIKVYLYPKIEGDIGPNPLDSDQQEHTTATTPQPLPIAPPGMGPIGED